MKTFYKKLALALALGAMLISCRTGSGEEKTLIEGTVASIDAYGGLVPSFTPAEFEAAGIEYGDLLTLCIGDDIEVPAPYVDAYTESGSMLPCLCNYNRANTAVTASMSNGSFSYHVGGKQGDRFVVKMKKKAGYLKEFELLQGTYTFDRADYPSDEAFANFRPINTSGLNAGMFYRSTSPISTTHNKVRFKYAARLCRENGIRTIVDIADTDEKVREFVGSQENIIALGSNADYLDTLFMRKLAYGFRRMIEKPAPYLIHCNEGKDRTGFYCLLIEALCGASIQQMKEDYMLTFENLYHQKKGTEQYELTWKKNAFRMLYLLANPQEWNEVTAINWDEASLDGYDFVKAAGEYLLKAGLSEEEVEFLKNTWGSETSH